jgi:hypothetical protein
MPKEITYTHPINGPFCVLKNATINKIRNIGVRPAGMHTAIAREILTGCFSWAQPVNTGL